MPMALSKLQIKVERTGEVINALFNPEEYTLNRDNNFAVQTVPGLASPLLQYVNGNVRTLDMELFFDTYDSPSTSKQDVRTLTDQVVHLMDIDSETHAPPIITVKWASLQFTCVLVKASQKFVMFSSEGVPVRARVSATFHEYVSPEQQLQETPKFSSDLSKVHVVHEGETLSAIAFQYYDDAESWRPLAIANELEDPRAISVGQMLRVPSLPFNDPQTGEPVG